MDSRARENAFTEQLVAILTAAGHKASAFWVDGRYYVGIGLRDDFDARTLAQLVGVQPELDRTPLGNIAYWPDAPISEAIAPR